MKTIYLAGGCFWGVEHFLEQFSGIQSLQVGYANSLIENPSYEMVVSKITQAAECVQVDYDPEQISLLQILYAFFQIIDPTSRNRQGNDIGTNYRTGIYTRNQEDFPWIEAFIHRIQREYKKPIVVEVGWLKNFYRAEEYHQKYLDKNPLGYCHIPLGKMHNFQLPTNQDLIQWIR